MSFVLFSCLFTSCCIQKHRVREMHTVFCHLKGSFRGVKGLGKGELAKKVSVRANRFTKSGAEAIEKGGGKVEVL